jgi:multidrug resistance efflux pump
MLALSQQRELELEHELAAARAATDEADLKLQRERVGSSVHSAIVHCHRCGIWAT